MVVARGRLRPAETDEIGGNQLRALMEKLVEAVLSVRSGLAPDDRAGLPFDLVVVLRDVFAVALHVDLLEVGGEAVHGLVIREDGVGLGAEEVVVPDAEEGHDDRHVLVERRLAEMFVHGVEAFEHLREVFGADLDHDGQADGGVEGVAAADPIPETEHIVCINAKILDKLSGRGDGDEMLRDGGHVVVESAEDPFLRGVGVRHGLHRRERLGGDDEKRLFRIQLRDGVDHVEAVDVGDEIDVQSFLREGLQGFAGHLGAEIGSADSDVDDVLDGLAGIAFPFAGADFVRENGHLVEHVMDVFDDVLPVDDELRVLRGAEGGVEDGAVFRLVDVDAVEHVFDGVLQAGLFGQLQEQGDRLVRDAVLGVVEIQIVLEFNDIALGALRILREEVFQLGVFDFVVMGLQGFPCGKLCDVFHAFLFPIVKWLNARGGRYGKSSESSPSVRSGCLFRGGRSHGWSGAANERRPSLSKGSWRSISLWRRIASWNSP